MNIGRYLMATAAAGTLAVALPAGAATLSVFNTGVGPDGTLLSDIQPDPHWSIVDGPTDVLQPGPIQPVTVNNDTYVLEDGPWVPNTATSRWISSRADQEEGVPPGNFEYEQVFNVPLGADPSTVQLAGQFAADNQATLYINGEATPFTSGVTDFGFVPFTVNEGFMTGENTISFVVGNGNFAPSGLHVQVSGTYGDAPPPVIPEPTNLALLGVGVGALALRLRRRVT